MFGLRVIAFVLAVAAPALAYRLGGTALWTVNAAALTVSAAIAAYVLWQDELLADVLVPKRLDVAWGVGLSSVLYFTVVLVYSQLVAPGETGGVLRQCAHDGPAFPREGLSGVARLFESIRVQVCRGYVQSVGVLGPLRGVLIVGIAALEEVAWRGGVQQGLSEKLGSTRGWIVASVLYAVAQAGTGNVALFPIALAGGLLWGGLYRYRGRLAPGIFGHAMFSYFLFAAQPLVTIR